MRTNLKKTEDGSAVEPEKKMMHWIIPDIEKRKATDLELTPIVIENKRLKREDIRSYLTDPSLVPGLGGDAVAGDQDHAGGGGVNEADQDTQPEADPRLVPGLRGKVEAGDQGHDGDGDREIEAKADQETQPEADPSMVPGLSGISEAGDQGHAGGGEAVNEADIHGTKADQDQTPGADPSLSRKN